PGSSGRGADSSGAAGLRSGSLTMSHATAPPMKVRAMTANQAGLGMPRNSLAGVKMASVRQYSQKPIMKRASRAPDSNMAEALTSAVYAMGGITPTSPLALRARPLSSSDDVAGELVIRWRSGRQSRRTVYAAKAVRPHPSARSFPQVSG